MSLNTFLENRGTYVGIRPTEGSIDNIVALQKTLRLENPLDTDKFHSTVLYSRKEIPVVPQPTIYNATITHIDCWEQADGTYAVVGKMDCPELTKRHDDLISAGGTHDFPSYQPHVTLSYNDKVKPMSVSVDVSLTGEYVEELDLEWKEDNDA